MSKKACEHDVQVYDKPSLILLWKELYKNVPCHDHCGVFHKDCCHDDCRVCIKIIQVVHSRTPMFAWASKYSHPLIRPIITNFFNYVSAKMIGWFFSHHIGNIWIYFWVKNSMVRFHSQSVSCSTRIYLWLFLSKSVKLISLSTVSFPSYCF